jgi:hypothetical protein
MEDLPMSLLNLVLSGALAMCNSQVMGTTTVNGREVAGVSTGIFAGVCVSGGDNSSKIQFHKHEVTVTGTEIQVAGKPAMTIPAECKKIKLIDSAEGVLVLLDGVEDKSTVQK